MTSTFDFNDRGQSAAHWLEQTETHRKATAAKVFDLGIPYLDDYTAGIFPTDLVLIGAETGVGKTTLVSMLSQSAAKRGKRVFFFALEAWPGEIESRVHYKCLRDLAYRSHRDASAYMRYSDWQAGKLDWIPAKLEALALEHAKDRLKNVTTYYRSRTFTVEDVQRQFLAQQETTDLFILDHVHYIDHDDPNENRALKDITKALREVALLMEKPVICVAHLRKKNNMFKKTRLVPTLDDFHGSSELTKIATKALFLAPARDVQSEPGTAATYMHVAKDRNSGRCPYVACVKFDYSSWEYAPTYKLGDLSVDGTDFEVIDDDKIPYWARSEDRKARR